MDIAAKLIICVILGAFYAPTVSAYEFIDPYPNVRVIDGDLHIERPGGGTTLAYPNAGISKEIPVNTSKGNYLVPVEKTLPISSAKVGKAATRFARALPVIGTGLAIYDALCDISDICSVDGQWKFKEDTDESRYSSVVGGTWQPSGLAPGGLSYLYSTYEQAWNETRCGSKGKAAYPQSECRFNSVEQDTTPPGFRIYYDFKESPIFGWVSGAVAMIHAGAYTFGPSSYREIVESDWAAAETKLNAQPEQTATALYNSDAPVPVSASTQSAPVTQQIAQTSTQTKDAQGNITGTQVATTSVKVEDTSTTNNVTYNITETTTITNYNENNEITGTQTSTSDNQPPKTGTDETTISFDDVPPAQLEEETPEFNLQTPVSWGEGTCPADVDLGIYDLKISYAPACDAADMLRPIFLLLASVTAMFIVAGVSRNKD
ncbi:MAG: virulence factor TspB C-terminal domain-related protein [Nitrosomonas sp.]|uniref:virulence factor TspB C-terminal domain-related protein n=1 Tax=Nitrosomonas sp. TaxID=42353 RepID=UPI002B3FC87C|nr:virulence factor TspB C-terminal domain-related protein [Nitrosomonas sp.]MEB2331750.1 virulence factor TspB C-terminal domain-related protein [Nitrosomonas sp.]